MHARSMIYAAVLASCTSTAWANTADVGVDGTISSLPTHETYSVASDFSHQNIFNPDPATAYTPLTDISSMPGALAHITGAGHTASASTTLSTNHTYASASSMPSNVQSTGGFSGWYDQVTINGGAGPGTANFTMQLNGIVDVGALPGGLAYALGSSSVHPSQLASSLQSFNVQSTPLAWPMDAVNPIATYQIAASPYNDPAMLLDPPIAEPAPGLGIPVLTDPSYSLGSDFGMSFPSPDLVLAPGMGQSINVTLTGALNFTYGEAFYLIGGMGASVVNWLGLDAFCAFDIGSSCGIPTIDGTGATTLDFSNSAHLVSIILPQGATASFASGETYNVTSVPEPAEWLMLLAGLGLVGWRVRRRD